MHLKRRLSLEHDDDSLDAQPPKRGRQSPALTTTPPSRDLISSLPAELLVRIFSYFSETDLLAIAPVSRLFHRVTSDRQLWRLHYLRRFILPRAHQIPGFKKDKARRSLAIRDGLRDGLAQDEGVISGDRVDWMKNYKLLHNWARGRCGVEEVKLHRKERLERKNRTLVKIIEGLAITADADAGLMVWDLRTRLPVAQTNLDLHQPGKDRRPSCLAVDDDRLLQGELGIAVGFDDGSYGVWRANPSKESFTQIACHVRNRNTLDMEAIAYCHPYIVTALTDGSVSIWTLEGPRQPNAEYTPYLLRSLRSYTTRAPLTLSTRRVGAGFVASIAYTVDAVGGWCIGIQDFDIRPSLDSSHPEIIDSRLSHTIPVDMAGSPSSSPRQGSTSSSSGGPVRLCYSHPYLLATLPDNTLLLHLVTTTLTSLSISKGIRLWGHTSGISDAEITARGKAVSVSARGDEIRVWELEGRVGGKSVEIRPRETSEVDEWRGLGEWWKRKVGFDEEMVIVLKEAGDGRESLMVYDFT